MFHHANNGTSACIGYVWLHGYGRAIQEAKQAVEGFIATKRKSTVQTEFPVEKAFTRLCKELQRDKSVKLEYSVGIYLMAVLDYVAADVLKVCDMCGCAGVQLCAVDINGEGC